MHTPTKAQFQIVIDNLEKVLPMATMEDHLNMMCGVVNDEWTCGTVHCLGGWYAVATLDLKETIDYIDGANKLARDLGLKHMTDFTEWAYINPNIWGNDNAMAMFCNTTAFSSRSRPDGARNLADIIQHLKEVQERLPV